MVLLEGDRSPPDGLVVVPVDGAALHGGVVVGERGVDREGAVRLVEAAGVEDGAADALHVVEARSVEGRQVFEGAVRDDEALWMIQIQGAAGLCCQVGKHAVLDYVLRVLVSGGISLV